MSGRSCELPRRHNSSGNSQAVPNAASGERHFIKPADNIGEKLILDYEGYANQHAYDLGIPGCGAGGARVFVGHRSIDDVVDYEITVALGEITSDNLKGKQTCGVRNLNNLQVVNARAVVTNGVSLANAGGWSVHGCLSLPECAGAGFAQRRQRKSPLGERHENATSVLDGVFGVTRLERLRGRR
jgi:hypothetical protein